MFSCVLFTAHALENELRSHIWLISGSVDNRLSLCADRNCRQLSLCPPSAQETTEYDGQERLGSKQAVFHSTDMIFAYQLPYSSQVPRKR